MGCFVSTLDGVNVFIETNLMFVMLNNVLLHGEIPVLFVGIIDRSLQFSMVSHTLKPMVSANRKIANKPA